MILRIHLPALFLRLADQSGTNTLIFKIQTNGSLWLWDRLPLPKCHVVKHGGQNDKTETKEITYIAKKLFSFSFFSEITDTYPRNSIIFTGILFTNV